MATEQELSEKADKTPSPGWVFCLRPIPGCPGYFVDRNGDAWSSINRGPRTNRVGGHLLKLKKTRDIDGYFRVSNSSASSMRTYVGLHRAVCMAFHGIPGEGQECCHNDGSRDNNCPENLRWGTVKENSHDRYKHGTDAVGANNGRALLSDEQVLAIRYEENGPRREVAAKYGISVRTVSKIRSCESWKHLIDPERKVTGHTRTPVIDRLGAEVIEEILASQERNSPLAKKYGISWQTVDRLKKTGGQKVGN